MEKPSINELQDDLLLKILSSIPTSEHTIATNFISKRWRGLSKLVSDVTFDSLLCDCFFIYRYFLNNAQTLQRLHMKLDRYLYSSYMDIDAWVQAAVDRSVREVEIDLFGNALELPSCLSTCTTLKTLILRDLIIAVVPPCFRLPSLKTLHLLSVKFSGDESVASLLRACPVLEVLVVDQTNKNVMISVPTLRSLSIDNSKGEQNMEESSINKLPDGLLLKILSLLSVKQSVETSLLSKRWRDLWRLVPVLKFDDKSYCYYCTFTIFVYRSLLFNNAQVLQRLDLKLRLDCPLFLAKDINVWVQAAVNRSVRELRIDLFGKTLNLPSCLSTCTTLKTLILRELSIEVVPPWFRLPSLKTLHLLSVKFSGEESLASLIQNCPVLEDLVVNKNKDGNMMIFNINVPTLKSLSIDNPKGKRTFVKEIHGFVIKAPALRNLNLKDTYSNFLMFEDMPEVIKANIVICGQSEFMGSLTSIKHLSLCCLTSETPYPRGTFFCFLEHLQLCTCSAGWWSLLARILKVAPRLRSLKLNSVSVHRAHYKDPMIRFSEPTSVPECLSTHLEMLEWRQFEGKEEERKVAAYILANATFLKMAIFLSRCVETNILIACSGS